MKNKSKLQFWLTWKPTLIMDAELVLRICLSNKVSNVALNVCVLDKSPVSPTFWLGGAIFLSLHRI